jgi:hypothetical protein
MRPLECIGCGSYSRGERFELIYGEAYAMSAPNTAHQLIANIGEIWAKLSKGKALFLLATIRKGGKSLAEQIRGKIAK